MGGISRGSSSVETGKDREFASIWSDLRGVGFTQGYLDAAGIRTRYLSSGSPDKPLLLLLHGTGGHAEAYVRNFQSHSKHFWTVAFDMIGHGWTDKPDVDYEIPVYVEHALNVIKALGRDAAHLSGDSLGGWVAAAMAVHHPQAVQGLVLNTAGGWTAHPEVMERIKKLTTEAAENPTWNTIRTRLEFLMHDKGQVSDDLVATRLAVYSQPKFAETMRRILCLQEMDIRRRNMISEAQYRAITSPTLVVWTSHDPTATPEEGKQIADMIPNSKFVVMNRCGHWPQFEDAPTFNRIQLDFLRGIAY